MKLKKWLLGLVTFAATVVICAVCAGAETYGDFEYGILDGTVMITDYNGGAEKVDIPEKIDGKSVTVIDTDAFRSCANLTSVTIPDSVTWIGSYAFYDCTSLKNVTIPASVTSIYSDAFGYYYDEDSKETKKVDGFKINYVKNSRGHLYAAQNGFTDEACLITNELDDGTLEIDRYAGNSATYAIPSVIDGKKVTGIGSYAFSNCTELTSITISDSVTRIGNNAFKNCISLTSVTIPDSVTSIGWSAFDDCTSLKDVTIPASVTSIGSDAFGYYFDNEIKKVDGFKINYVKNTEGHRYAAENGFTDEVYFEVEKLVNGTIRITECVSPTESCVIPSTIDGLPVTEINRAFAGCTGITNITIPDSVTDIGWNTFYGCISLTSITIPDSVTYIGFNAFEGCTSLTNVTIPDSVTGIEIAGDAFYNCTSLKEVTIPASVTSIGYEAFGYYDDNGTKKVDGFKINYVKNSEGHRYAAVCGFTDEAYIDTTVLDDGTLSIDRCYGGGESFTIPSEIDGVAVTEISDKAFLDNSRILTFTIPESIKKIGEHAIGFCYYNYEYQKIYGITINYVKNSVGHRYAVENGFTDEVYLLTKADQNGGLWITRCICSNETYDIPSKIDGLPVIGIGESAFEGNRFKSITIPDSVTNISDCAFLDCLSLKEISIPESVSHIGVNAFGVYTEKTEHEKWGNGEEYIKYYCKPLEDFTIEYVKNTVGHLYALDAGFTTEPCYFIVNTLSDGTAEIAKGHYANVVDFDLTIPAVVNGKKVTRIADKAFCGCDKMLSVSLPDTITYIGENAFSDCSALQSIEVNKSNKYFSTEDGVLYNADKSLLIYYPMGKKSTSFIISDSVKNIGEGAFIDVKNLTDVTIPNSVTSIGNSAFRNCSNLKSVTIPASVTEIGSCAFLNCANLTSVTIPDSVTNIGSYTFANCANLTSVTIPASVTGIGGFAFGYDAPYYRTYGSDYSISFDNNEGYYFKQIRIVYISYGVYPGDDYSPRRKSDFNIYCYLDTAGEKYAKDKGFTYELIDHTHIFGDWTTTEAATCTAEGTQTRTCSVCNKVETQTIAALGHNYSTAWTTDKAATCGTAGSKSHHCTRCGDKKDVTAISATGNHKFGNWTTTNAATCMAEGTQTRTCSGCGKVETQTIAKTAHKYVNTVVKPTYTAQGYTLHKCSVCGTSYKDTYTAKLTLAKVTGAKLGGRAADALRINWTKNASADGYIVEMYQGGKWVRVAKITSNSTTTFRKAGLKA